MKIGFDGRYAEEDLVGVGKYIINLVSQISKKEKCIVFYSKEPKFKIKGKNIKSIVLSTKNRYIFEQIALPLALINNKVDLYHAVGNMGIPLICPVPAIVTVHDIIPLEIKDYFSYSPFPLLSKLSYFVRLYTSLKGAVKIITVSNYVKSELVKKINIDSSKILTIYSGAPAILKQGILPKNLIGEKYILNNGGIDIRKNLDRLIEAFSIVQNKKKYIKLAITGDNKKIRNNLQKLVNKLGLVKSVIFTGYVSDKILFALITNAKMVCYPTLSEGFGFPILEGFGAGTPVISSDTSSIPEIAGNAAMLVDPGNVNKISRAMEKVLSDSSLIKAMVLKGKARYNKFNWSKSANEYLDLYHNI